MKYVSKWKNPCCYTPKAVPVGQSETQLDTPTAGKKQLVSPSSTSLPSTSVEAFGAMVGVSNVYSYHSGGPTTPLYAGGTW